MNIVKDMFGTHIVVNDVVVFGKSDRNNPINVGVVKMLDFDKQEVVIFANGGHRPSKVPMYHCGRMLVLPEGCKEHLELGGLE